MFPAGMLAPWIDGYLAELSIFPNGRHDDQVDQTTQALNRLSGGAAYGLTTYLDELQGDPVALERMRATAERLRANSVRFGVVPKQVDPESAKNTAGCPECGSHVVQVVSSGGYRCGMCGEQWEAGAIVNLSDIPGNTRVTTG